MTIPESKRWRHKGRQSEPSFIRIPHFVLASEQWGRMDAFAMKLLFELARQYKGSNNGDLSATVEMLKARGFGSKDTLPAKLKWLEVHGWIVRTRQGGRHVGCNLFAITFWAIDECGGKHHATPERKPSHLWKNAIATPPAGERNPASRGAKPRQPGSKTARPPPAGEQGCPPSFGGVLVSTCLHPASRAPS